MIREYLEWTGGMHGRSPMIRVYTVWTRETK